MRTWFPVALLFVASTALAQGPGQGPADISVAIIADSTYDGNQTINWQIDVTNNGPNEADDVQITGSSDRPSLGGCNGLIPPIAAGTHTLVPCQTFAPAMATDLVLTAKAETLSVATPDPNPANNVATKTIHTTGGPDLNIFLRVPDINPGVPFAIGASYGNNSLADAATGVVVTLGIPTALQIVSIPQNCTQSPGVVTCSLSTVPAHTISIEPNLVVTAVADDSVNGQTLQFTADIKGNEPEGSIANNHSAATVTVVRTFYVTDTTDSLADAIDAANRECTSGDPCKIAFRLGTPPASGYFTLKPHRKLASITGKAVSIDGSTQTRLTGDTNPNGPEIFIDGSENAWEDAIVFAGPCGGEVGFVAIGNFRNAAVTMFGSTDDPVNACGGKYPAGGAYVHDSYLGVDPTGTNAAPNGRGVVISDKVFGGTVSHNLISGNRRSGVWIGMALQPSVYDNTIGLDIHRQPLPNGASGIFAGPLVTNLDITSNFIAFNHDFGVAIDRRAVGVNLNTNSIFANLQLGIDIGLDGPTPDRDVPAPVIVSAHYDPASDKTIVVLSAHEPKLDDLPVASLYASDAPHPSGFGDGQYVLGQQAFDPASGGLTVSVKGDWRGKWVSATVTQNDFPFASLGHSTTSEFSRAVKVE
jgi:hypothetical protein